MITMLLGGLWHGANWKFIFWGAMHGVALAMEKLFNSLVTIKQNLFTKIAGIFITFHFVCFCWIFFKANSFNDGIIILKQIFFNFSPELLIPMLNGYGSVFLFMLLGYVLHFIPRSVDLKAESQLIKMPMLIKSLMLAILIWIVIQVKSAEQVLPIYLQF